MNVEMIHSVFERQIRWNHEFHILCVKKKQKNKNKKQNRGGFES